MQIEDTTITLPITIIDQAPANWSRPCEWPEYYSNRDKLYLDNTTQEIYLVAGTVVQYLGVKSDFK